MFDVIAVIPSRGLIFAETIDAVCSNLYMCGLTTTFPVPLIEWDKPIPDAQNALIERALKIQCRFIWMVEEDIVPNKTMLRDLLYAAEEQYKFLDVVSARYKLSGGTSSDLYNEQDHKLLFNGFGCTLFRASMMQYIQALEKPWFTTTREYRMGDKLEYSGTRKDGYGGHDIDFYATLPESANVLVLPEAQCKHLKIEKYGEPMVNNGCHKIKVL